MNGVLEIGIWSSQDIERRSLNLGHATVNDEQHGWDWGRGGGILGEIEPLSYIWAAWSQWLQITRKEGLWRADP